MILIDNMEPPRSRLFSVLRLSANVGKAPEDLQEASLSEFAQNLSMAWTFTGFEWSPSRIWNGCNDDRFVKSAKQLQKSYFPSFVKQTSLSCEKVCMWGKICCEAAKGDYGYRPEASKSKLAVAIQSLTLDGCKPVLLKVTWRIEAFKQQ